jgi:hypothetical protein
MSASTFINLICAGDAEYRHQRQDGGKYSHPMDMTPLMNMLAVPPVSATGMSKPSHRIGKLMAK